MLGPADPDSSVRYLTLSVFARQLVQGFQQSRGKPQPLKRVLWDALRAFRSVTEAQDATWPDSLQPFRDYEELSTLYDVLSRTQAGNDDAHDKLVHFVPKLQQLHDDPSSTQDADLDAVIRFFTELANEASYRARRPPEGIAPQVLELCRKL